MPSPTRLHRLRGPAAAHADPGRDALRHRRPLPALRDRDRLGIPRRAEGGRVADALSRAARRGGSTSPATRASRPRPSARATTPSSPRLLADVFRGRTAAEWERDLSVLDVACVELATGPIARAVMHDPIARDAVNVRHEILPEIVPVRILYIFAHIVRDIGFLKGHHSKRKYANRPMHAPTRCAVTLNLRSSSWLLTNHQNSSIKKKCAHGSGL